MEFVFDTPIAKTRHRTSFAKKMVYDPQKAIMAKYKQDALAQMRAKGFLKPLEGPVSVFTRIDLAMPKSWSQKRKKELFGKPKDTKPDNDNFEKFVFDVLSGIAYNDDGQISGNVTECYYAYKSLMTVYVTPHVTSLIDDLHQIGKQAVQFHETLDNLYQWANSLQKTYTQQKQIQSIAQVLQEKCLEGGLFEIYGAAS